MRGETKGVVLEEYDECPAIVEFSVYDTTPVNFLSILAEKLVWNINEKEIYDKVTRKKFKL